jgi:glycosyltransferase involved in cell wall biosynthesis
MRIGFEAKRATHNFRGLGNYSRGLIEGLIKYHGTEEYILYSPPFKDQRAQKWISSLEGSYELKEPKRFIKSHFASFWRSFLLSKELKKDHLNIFHGLSHEIPFGLNGSQSFKKIVTMHDLIFLRFPQFFPFIDRAVYNQKFRYACKHSDLVVAICQQTKEDLIRFLGVEEKKIIVHYQSCSPLFYDEISLNERMSVKMKYALPESYILNVGAFEERKNQLILLESFANIKNKIKDNLVFIGQKNEYQKKVEARVAELKLNDRVHFLSSVPHNDLPALYQMAKIFCFPSLFEGFGIPIIEALFSKIPVITSFGSCFPESAGPNSYYIDPQSISSLSLGLMSVLGNENLQTQMRKEGFDYVQRFHQKESSDQLMDIYRQV